MRFEIDGFCAEGFERIVDAFSANFEERQELGASFALVRHGEMLVDIWGGARDASGNQPWEEDTIVNVYSTTKTMAALATLLLMDRKELEPGSKVAKFWPEFADHGKGDITVGQLLSHSAGLSGIDEPVTETDLYDHDKIVTLLAAQEPWWEPGSASGYHALTQGYLLGEVVSRITNTSLGTFFRREIADPLGADFHIGLDEEEDDRVGELVPPDQPPDSLDFDPTSIAGRTFANPAIRAEWSANSAWRRAEIPAAGGHGNARSVARVMGMMAAGGQAFGHYVLSEKACRLALEEQTSGVDLVLGVPVRYGLGFGLVNETQPLPSPNACFWGGWGGSLVIVDFDQHMAFSYVMNRMESGLLGDDRGASLTQAVYEAIAEPR